MTNEHRPDTSREQNVELFAQRAEAFGQFVRRAASYPLPERCRLAAKLLADLYSASLALPEVEPESDDAPPDVTVPENWPGFGEHESYWEVFDPYEQDEPVVGSLSDDMLDVCRDIEAGLVLYRQGNVDEAVWHWRFSRQIHWGDHAVDALKALQRVLKDEP
jgi:hypothetical protein